MWSLYHLASFTERDLRSVPWHPCYQLIFSYCRLGFLSQQQDSTCSHADTISFFKDTVKKEVGLGLHVGDQDIDLHVSERSCCLTLVQWMKTCKKTSPGE